MKVVNEDMKKAVFFLIFATESLFQTLFYTIKTKYFVTFMQHEKLVDIFFDCLSVVGSLKLGFFLPVYFIAYFIKDIDGKSWINNSLIHSLIFFIVFLIMGLLMPAFVFHDPLDILFLLFITFFNHLIISWIFK